jgi:phosphoribosylanthranilate isomerase
VIGDGPAPAIKFCGLTRPEDARAAADAGAAYLGVVLAPGGRRSLALPRAAEVLAETDVARVGVFVNASLPEIVEAIRSLGLDVVQLHGEEPPEFVRQVRAAAAVEVWKAVRPRDGQEVLRAAERYATLADALLLDGWSPSAYGGTGASFPWEQVAAVRTQLGSSVRLVIAGGLTPQNVARAVDLLAPNAVDVSSGVEASPGVKDGAAIRAFVDAVRRRA